MTEPIEPAESTESGGLAAPAVLSAIRTLGLEPAAAHGAIPGRASA